MNVRCDVCGNHYANGFEIRRDGEAQQFDCFECAIHALAPHCDHCGCQILGHGLEADDHMYCCAHCQREATAGIRR